jgi:hypothetical protein
VGLFRAASLQTRRARFPGTGLSRDSCREIQDGGNMVDQQAGKELPNL